ncbi:MAG: YbhB/YbcL family Raf kinase inhibitor-like protein [Candidatus Zipacnadales bacterium]
MRLFICLLLGSLFLALVLFTGCPKPASESTSAVTPTPPPETSPPRAQSTASTDTKAATWKLTSTAFEDGQPIPPIYTADGDDISPPLAWTDPPQGTVELALICEDPDAPAGTWVHWVLYGLPADTRELPEGVPTEKVLSDLGEAKQGTNDFKKIGYGGPAPPAGSPHHYHFTLYALSDEVELKEGATATELRTAMQGSVLAKVELVGTYSR